MARRAYPESRHGELVAHAVLLRKRRFQVSVAAPGIWLTSERRVAVAAEVRQAHRCAFCRRIKDALSRHALQRSHEHSGVPGGPEVERIHRVISDPGSLREGWSRSALAGGLSEGESVEIVGIIASVSILDTRTLAPGSS